MSPISGVQRSSFSLPSFSGKGVISRFNHPLPQVVPICGKECPHPGEFFVLFPRTTQTVTDDTFVTRVTGVTPVTSVSLKHAVHYLKRNTIEYKEARAFGPGLLRPINYRLKRNVVVSGAHWRAGFWCGGGG